MHDPATRSSYDDLERLMPASLTSPVSGHTIGCSIEHMRKVLDAPVGDELGY